MDTTQEKTVQTYRDYRSSLAATVAEDQYHYILRKFKNEQLISTELFVKGRTDKQDAVNAALEWTNFRSM